MERLPYILSLSLGFFLCFISFRVQAQIIPDSDAKLRTVKVERKGLRLAQIIPDSDAKLRMGNFKLGPSTRTPEGIKEKVSPVKFDRKERKIWNN